MKHITLGLLLMGFTLFLSACDFHVGGGEHDDVRPFQTQILEVIIKPHPIPVGETARLRVIIEDSLDTRFKFTWFADGLFEITQTNELEWIADANPGRYTFLVVADNGSSSEDRPRYTFHVDVVQ